MDEKKITKSFNKNIYNKPKSVDYSMVVMYVQFFFMILNCCMVMSLHEEVHVIGDVMLKYTANDDFPYYTLLLLLQSNKIFLNFLL